MTKAELDKMVAKVKKGAAKKAAKKKYRNPNKQKVHEGSEKGKEALIQMKKGKKKISRGY